MRWEAGHPVLSHAENGGRELKYKKRPKGYSLVHRGSILNVNFWEKLYGSIVSQTALTTLGKYQKDMEI